MSESEAEANGPRSGAGAIETTSRANEVSEVSGPEGRRREEKGLS